MDVSPENRLVHPLLAMIEVNRIRFNNRERHFDNIAFLGDVSIHPAMISKCRDPLDSKARFPRNNKGTINSRRVGHTLVDVGQKCRARQFLAIYHFLILPPLHSPQEKGRYWGRKHVEALHWLTFRSFE
jgi:hypothetical protein